MARRRRRKTTIRPDANLSLIAKPRLIRPIALTLPSRLVEVEDRRRHNPLGFFQPAKRIDGTPARVVIKKSAPARARSFSSWFPNTRVAFDVPNKVNICVRRKQRKEVLHALKKTGRGGGRRKPPRRNWYSSVSC